MSLRYCALPNPHVVLDAKYSRKIIHPAKTVKGGDTLFRGVHYDALHRLYLYCTLFVLVHSICYTAMRQCTLKTTVQTGGALNSQRNNHQFTFKTELTIPS